METRWDYASLYAADTKVPITPQPPTYHREIRQGQGGRKLRCTSLPVPRPIGKFFGVCMHSRFRNINRPSSVCSNATRETQISQTQCCVSLPSPTMCLEGRCRRQRLNTKVETDTSARLQLPSAKRTQKTIVSLRFRDAEGQCRHRVDTQGAEPLHRRTQS